MNRTVLCLLAALACATSAFADAQVALDYHTKVKGCPSPDRFADEVSAKLGFVPWDAQAQTAIRVRITQDSGDFVGTLEQPDNTSKVLRAPTCAKLDEALVSAVAVALDRSTPATASGVAAKPDERRLQKLERDPDAMITVRLRAKDGRELEISRVLSESVFFNSTQRAAAVQFETLCKVPCTARVPQGRHTFLIHDVKNEYTVREEATVDVNSTLDLDYTSRAATRRATYSRAKWGLILGFIAGAAATAYLVETQTDHRALHSLDIAGGSVGMLLGGVIGYVAGPGMPADEARIDVHPGLTTASF